MRSAARATTQRAPAEDVHPTRILAIAVSPERCWPLAVSGNLTWTPTQPVDTAEVIAKPSWFVKSILTSSARLLPDARVIVGGSPSKAVDLLERALQTRTGLRIWRFGRDLPCRLKVMPRPAADWGDWIRLQALGALSVDTPRPWVVIDCGTVLTVSAVRPSKGRYVGVLEGSLTMAGERLALEWLCGGSSRRTPVTTWPPRPSAELPAIGRSKEEALRVGVRRAQLAAIVSAASAQAHELGPGTRLMLTGRWLDYVYKEVFRQLKHLEPDLNSELDAMGLLAAWDHAHGPLFQKA